MKIPIKQFNKNKVRISQIFGANPQSYSKYKDDFGNPLIGHNGVDLVIGFNNQEMYGADLFYPVKGNVFRKIFDSPMSSKGNGVYINSDEYIGADGLRHYDLYVLWHLMEVDGREGQVEEGEYAGSMGNSGDVRPIPISSQPYNGVHLHWGKYPYVFKDNIWQKQFSHNGYDGAVNPLEGVVDLNPPDWKRNPALDDILDRLPPIRWAIEIIKKNIESLKK